MDGPQDRDAPLTTEQKKENTAFFFEELWSSIDMNILIIFCGLFVVIENIDSTGIPSKCWNLIVGDKPFRTVSSVIGISLFVLAASQTIGNVPIIQMAVSNVTNLEPIDKRYAWAILSFVSTIGGNLTLTGSAANIIVAEKVMRIDPKNQLDFWKHFHCCFWTTLLCCGLGALIITGLCLIDNDLSGFS
jgi:Na+/H+ antiporter NhaD/arsenite permease-like protein